MAVDVDQPRDDDLGLDQTGRPRGRATLRPTFTIFPFSMTIVPFSIVPLTAVWILFGLDDQGLRGREEREGGGQSETCRQPGDRVKGLAEHRAS